MSIKKKFLSENLKKYIITDNTNIISNKKKIIIREILSLSHNVVHSHEKTNFKISYHNKEILKYFFAYYGRINKVQSSCKFESFYHY
jgi:hypothetical protein